MLSMPQVFEQSLFLFSPREEAAAEFAALVFAHFFLGKSVGLGPRFLSLFGPVSDKEPAPMGRKWGKEAK